MNAIQKLIGFLTTLWGLLAVASAAFPGAAALMDLPIAANNSKIAALYPVIGTVASAFCLLLLISYQRELREITFARRLAIRSVLLGFVLFFSFVTVRSVYLDIQVAQQAQPPQIGAFTLTHRSLGLLKVEHFVDGKLIQIEERGDPLDVLALALFASTFASFTLGFSALGVYTYERSQG